MRWLMRRFCKGRIKRGTVRKLLKSGEIITNNDKEILLLRDKDALRAIAESDSNEDQFGTRRDLAVAALALHPTTTRKEQVSILCDAVRDNKFCVQFLLCHAGVDVNARNDDGQTCLEIAVEMAARSRSYGCEMAARLIGCGADVEVSDKFITNAIRSYCAAVAELLLSKGRRVKAYRAKLEAIVKAHEQVRREAEAERIREEFQGGGTPSNW